MFIITLKKSVIVTYLGVVCGVISMTFAFSKIAFSEVEYLRYSLIFLMLAGLCDMFDGKVARRCKRTREEKEFGIQIDSLADTINFVVLPVIIMLSLGMTSILAICLYALFALCGITRLGVFNCNANPDVSIDYFTGLPVTSSAIIYPILGIFHGQVPDAVFSAIYLTATFITAVLFVTKIKVPKLKGNITHIAIPVLMIAVPILLLVVR